jgi:hypothetical protein
LIVIVEFLVDVTLVPVVAVLTTVVAGTCCVKVLETVAVDVGLRTWLVTVAVGNILVLNSNREIVVVGRTTVNTVVAGPGTNFVSNMVRTTILVLLMVTVFSGWMTDVTIGILRVFVAVVRDVTVGPFVINVRVEVCVDVEIEYRVCVTTFVVNWVDTNVVVLPRVNVEVTVTVVPFSGIFKIRALPFTSPVAFKARRNNNKDTNMVSYPNSNGIRVHVRCTQFYAWTAHSPIKGRNMIGLSSISDMEFGDRMMPSRKIGKTRMLIRFFNKFSELSYIL